MLVPFEHLRGAHRVDSELMGFSHVLDARHRAELRELAEELADGSIALNGSWFFSCAIISCRNSF